MQRFHASELVARSNHFEKKKLLFHFVWPEAMKYLEMPEATIEDLAFPMRSSRASDCIGRRGCLSAASSAADEKSGEGMALKI